MNANPIPVLLMVRELHIGGIERDVAKIATTLERGRFETHVATYYPEGLRYEELRAAEVPILRLPVGPLLSAATVRAGLELRRYIRKNRIQIVHAWDSTAILGVPVARLCGVPVIIASQLGHRDIVDHRTVWLQRMTDRAVDAVIVNCEALRGHMVRDEGLPVGHIELCYNGVNTREFYPAYSDKPNDLRGAGLVIGAVAALRWEKGLEVLQEAFAQVRHLDSAMKLVIVGSGPELPRLQRNRDRLLLNDRCVFVPATSEVARWLRAMDIFVLPSHSEAFSNALLEAMACGCAPIATRVGGSPELLGEDERGLLCQPGDPGDLAEKLARLATDPLLRKVLATRAAKFAREWLSIERAAERISEIYMKLLPLTSDGAMRQRLAKHVDTGVTNKCA